MLGEGSIDSTNVPEADCMTGIMKHVYQFLRSCRLVKATGKTNVFGCPPPAPLTLYTRSCAMLITLVSVRSSCFLTRTFCRLLGFFFRLQRRYRYLDQTLPHHHHRHHHFRHHHYPHHHDQRCHCRPHNRSDLLKERQSTHHNSHKPYEHIQTIWDAYDSIFLADVQPLLGRLRYYIRAKLQCHVYH